MSMIGHNQQFERAVWNARIGPKTGVYIVPEQQDCTMSRAAAAGLPHSLDNLGVALDLSIKKDKAGHALMLRMSKPKSREPLAWHETEDELRRLADYCDDDVRSECAADLSLPPLSDRERRVWVLDQKINDRGFAVDIALAQAADAAVKEAQRRADTAMWKITDGAVAKASQTAKLAAWVRSRGIACDSVADQEMDELLVSADMLDDEPVTEALQLRRNSAGAFKFEAMLRAVCSDGRIRGGKQYHGTHGGRWAGRVVQPDNFKRVSEEEAPQVALALDILRTHGGDPSRALDAMEMLLDIPPLEALSLCARPMIVARPGYRLLDADFSNIEGRFRGWFAGATRKLEVFRAYDRKEGPDSYRVTAGSILEKDPYTVTKTERQDWGKVPDLSCGFQGGWRAVQKQAAKLGIVLTRFRAQQIVEGWRRTSPDEVAMWAELQQAAIDAVRAPGCIVSCCDGKVRYLKPADQDFLWCLLPSSRVISYAKPVLGWRHKVVDIDGEPVEVDNFGLTYMGQKNGRWLRLDLYGGMQTAHVVSGTARDFLVDALMFPVEAAGYPLTLHVHDEGLCEAPVGFGSLAHFETTITNAARDCPWAKGLPVAISAWEDVRYVK